MQQFVPVVSRTGKALMPTSNRKANRLIEKGRAVRRFDRGLFYIQLTDREDGYTQSVAVGIDPGSKKEALTVKSAAHTYLNIQADAVTWVQEAEKTSTQMRRTRRYRKMPSQSSSGSVSAAAFDQSAMGMETAPVPLVGTPLSDHHLCG